MAGSFEQLSDARESPRIYKLTMHRPSLVH